MSVLDYALPQRPPQARDEERDPSERALPRRSSSPIIGSPPVRAVPIGTPPKQAAIPNFNQQVPPRFPTSHCSQGCKLLPGGVTVPLASSQILCPKPVHIRATMQQRYPAPYGERMSPNQLCNVPVSSLLSSFLGIDDHSPPNLPVFLWLIPTPWSLPFLGFTPFACCSL